MLKADGLALGKGVIHGYETVFPIPLGLSCTWDMEAIEKSARIAAVEASADVENPEDQGEVAMIGVFIDTFVVLTMTALVILSSGVLEEMMSTGVKGTPVAQAAFRTGLKGFGPAFVAICLLFFAFSTIVGWYFFARQNVQYLFGKKAVVPFSLIVVVFVFLGSLLKVDLVWNLSDLFNGLMVIPNLMALIVLAGTVAKAAKGEKVEF